MEEDGVALHPRRGAARRPTSASWPSATRVGTRQGQRARRPALHAAVPVLRRHAERVPGARPATSCRPRTAPASCTWRPASARTTRSRATPPASRRSCPMDEHGRYTAEVAAVGRRARVRRQPRRRSSELKDRGVVVRHDTYDHSYPHCWRCDQPLVYRAIASGSCRSPTFRDRMVELNQQIRWVPEHVKDGSFGKWLANARDWSISRNRFWGSPIPVWRSDDPTYPRIDVYGSIAELERDFGVHGRRPAPPVGRRPRAPEPRRPDRPVDDAPRPRGARLLVRVRLDAVRPGALPVRERRVVRGPLPGRLHRRVHRPDPRLVLHAARAGHRAVRPPGVPHLRQPRHRARRRRPEDVEEPPQLPRPDEVFDTYGADAMRWYLLSSTDPARRRLGGHRERHPRDACATSCCRSGTRGTFFTLYANAAGHTAARTHRLDRRARPVHPRQAARISSPTSPTAMDAYDLFGACGIGAHVPRRADQLVHAPQSAIGSGPATRTRSTRCTPC